MHLCGARQQDHRNDNYDHLYESTGYNEAGLETGGALGLARSRRLYDKAHRLFAILHFGEDGQPARYRGCFVGYTCPDEPWHAVRVVRGPDGTALQNLFFDADRQLVGSIACETARRWR